MPDLYQELINLADSDVYPFHMPGHKRNLESTPMKGAFRCDITEIDGFDNLHDSNGILLKAQQRANELYSAEVTFFLINGSTCGVLSAVSAVMEEGGTILAARGSHRSFYNAAYLRHINIKYLPYKMDNKYRIPVGYTASDIEEMLTDDIQAVFITSPTYEGKISDIKGIAKACHSHGVPLIVDAAHGAHFVLSKHFKDNSFAKECCEQWKEDVNIAVENNNILYTTIPEDAIQQGADIVIHSVHKTLPSMTQTALLHVQGEFVNYNKIRRFLSIYQSSSPSYVMMSSIDLCIREIENNGKEFASRLLKYRNMIAIGTAKCRYIEVVGKNDIPDAAKILISVNNAAMTGHELYDILREEYKLQLEMAGDSYALAIISGWDRREGIVRLIDAINAIDARIEIDNGYFDYDNNANNDQPLDYTGSADGRLKDSMPASKLNQEFSDIVISMLPERINPLYEAWDAEAELVGLDHAIGRISGGFINLYPPGIPLIVPGERFSKTLIEDIEKYQQEGLSVQGVADRKEVLCVRQK